jgi:predicted dehydrogenase
MTWLMDNQRPLKVTALAQTEKPQIYARVDDKATILLEYPKAQGVIEASWNWPFNRKDLEVYGETGYAIATTGGSGLKVRLAKGAEESRTPAGLPPDERDSISYLKAVARGKIKPSGLSGLENNVIVTEILDAARESARTGRTIALTDVKRP